MNIAHMWPKNPRDNSHQTYCPNTHGLPQTKVTKGRKGRQVQRLHSSMRCWRMPTSWCVDDRRMKKKRCVFQRSYLLLQIMQRSDGSRGRLTSPSRLNPFDVYSDERFSIVKSRMSSNFLKHHHHDCPGEDHRLTKWQGISRVGHLQCLKSPHLSKILATKTQKSILLSLIILIYLDENTSPCQSRNCCPWGWKFRFSHKTKNSWEFLG